MEAYVAEVGLYQSGLQVGDANGGIRYVDAQPVGNGFHRCLGSAIYVAAGVGCIARHTAYVDDMAFVAFHHARHYKACHGEQSLDVGINHGVPILGVPLVFLVKSQSQPGIVDQYVHLFPGFGQRLPGLLSCFGIAYVKG